MCACVEGWVASKMLSNLFPWGQGAADNCLCMYVRTPVHSLPIHIMYHMGNVFS